MPANLFHRAAHLRKFTAVSATVLAYSLWASGYAAQSVVTDNRAGLPAASAGQNAVAVGYGSTAADVGTAVGTQATAETFGTAVGYYAHAQGGSSTAIGDDART